MSFPNTCRVFLVVIFVISLNGCEWNPHYQIRIETVRLESPHQIVPITKPVVAPVLYKHIAGFDVLPVEEAKEKFIAVMLPSILIARYEIEQNRKRIAKLSDKIRWTNDDSLFYFKTKSHYRAKDMSDLIIKMKPLPNSIVLAQAAIESGWGKSRIFKKANNVFGVWSFNKHEPRIAALVKRGNKRIYLRLYTDISHSVTHYFEIIGRAKSFEKLRNELSRTNDPLVLVPYLKNYSERRTAYTSQLASVIVKNGLLKYDDYILDPTRIKIQDQSDD